MTLSNKDFPWVSRISWDSKGTISWNEICARVIEDFGLPGDRYITDVGMFEMAFIFRNPQDLIFFKLKWSEYEL
jgi:hypothetical protein